MLGELIGAASSLLGGIMGGNKAEENAKRQEKLQKDFAQQGIRWKVNDAKKAGISPLYALGANTVSYSPQAIGDSLSPAIANMGQSLGRAVDATSTSGEKMTGFQNMVASTQLEGMKIDNEIKRAELASKLRLTQANGPTPGFPLSETIPFIPGQGTTKGPELEISRKMSPADPNIAHAEAGINPEVAMYRSPHGYTSQIPQQLGESLESAPFWMGWQWAMRNNLLPAVNESYKTVPYPAPPGAEWNYNVLTGEYTLGTTHSGKRPFTPSFLNDRRG